MRRTHPRLRPAEDGASPVVGEILLLGIVLALAGLVALSILGKEPPSSLQSDLSYDLLCTDGSWGDANDAVVLRHGGGETLERDRVRLLLEVDGTRTEFDRETLGGAFQDGAFSIGETWAHATPLDPAAVVHVELAYRHAQGAEQLKTVVEGQRSCPPLPVPPVPPPSGVFDPGFPYEDVDGDCLYQDGVDVALDPADVLDGVHHAAAGNGLVLPPSVGLVDVPSSDIDFHSGGGCLVIATPLRTPNEHVNALDSNGGPLRVVDTSLAAGKSVVLRSDGGDVTLENVDANAVNEHLTVDSGGGDVTVVGTLAAQKHVTLDAGAGTLVADGATIRSINEGITVDAGEVVAPDAVFHGQKQLRMTVAGDVDLRRTELRSDSETITLDKTLDANLLQIQDAEVFEPNDNDRADVRPDHTQGVVGVPAVGGLE